MGQSCSSEISRKKKKPSQSQTSFKKKSEPISHHIQQNNDHYVQANVVTHPPESIPNIEKEVSEQHNQTLKPLEENQTKSVEEFPPKTEDNIHKDEQKETNEQENCPICLESFETLGETPTFTICNHAFCSKCYQGALAIKPYCPLCRTFQLNRAREPDDNGDLNPLRVSEDDWNVEVVRAHLRGEPEEDGSRRVVLSNGEQTNIFVGQNAKVQISPNANLFINGKRVENPQDCNVQ